MDTQAFQKENVICNFPCPPFFLPVNTWTGLGEYGVGETEGNGIKTGLAMLPSLPGNLPGIFPDLPGLRPFDLLSKTLKK